MPEISVVIATFNRAGELARCLGALADQDVPAETYEVVVVDDGSTDGTLEVLRSNTALKQLRFETQSNRGQAAALNRGMDLATGEFCLFVDDDVVAHRSLVGEHLRAQRKHDSVIAFGKLTLHLVGGGGGLVRHFAAWWRDHYDRLDRGVLVPDFRSCYSGNLSVPLGVARQVGGYDARLARSFDVEFAYRLVEAGLRIVYVPGAVAEHRQTKGFRAIVRDFDRAGAAAVELHRRHPEFIRYPPLGDFGQGTFPTMLLRRVLLALRAPVWPLAAADRVLAGKPSARLYFFLQQYCFWRSVRSALDDRDEWRRLTRGTVVLIYHALGGVGEKPSRYVLPLSRFRRQLRWLQLRGYRIISLDEYARTWSEGRLPPPKSVVITFDDGYADNAELSSDDLRQLGAEAVVFIVSSLVGESNQWTPEPPLHDRPLLSWEQLRKLRDDGIAVGAHTVSHPRLTDLDPEEASREVVESRAALELRLGERVAHFAYPYGKTSNAVQRIVSEAGYVTACGIQPGANGAATPIHDLRRIEVEGTWSLPTFALSVWSGFPPALGSRR
jgi:glycosyltransferase involved in cell wall biosynthesis/peptidoglycan/xylan/chitin deacetylase (PgdA/CDA1 family)